eukprot:SAG31_NODE_167_length_21485_cov_31.094922_11_plen_84_part_00
MWLGVDKICRNHVQNKLSSLFAYTHLVADHGGDFETGAYILGEHHGRNALLVTISLSFGRLVLNDKGDGSLETFVATCTTAVV